MPYRIPDDLIGEKNAKIAEAQDEDYAALGRRLERSGVDIDAIAAKTAAFAVAVPTWGLGTGGTRFARFPGPGEPRGIFDKLEDCATIHQLTRATPTCSPHFPWDKVSDTRELAERAKALSVGFDAVNSNTFQDQPGQKLSYKFGSLTHSREGGARSGGGAQPRMHRDRREARLEGADGLDRRRLELPRTVEPEPRLRLVSRVAGRDHLRVCPADWRVFLEHKLYEPAFYSTVISDWGTSLMAAQALGPKAFCLVDLGHHAPNVNIEQIVARLIRAGKLAGFHFNDSKYGDDDLDTGSIDPFRLYRVFNELVDASARGAPGFDPAYMLDQSHNVTDPIESLMASAMEAAAGLRAGAPRRPAALEAAQEANDVMLRIRIFKAGFVDRRVADPRRGAAARRRRDRSDRGLSRLELPRPQGEGAPGRRWFVIRNRLGPKAWPGR